MPIAGINEKIIGGSIMNKEYKLEEVSKLIRKDIVSMLTESSGNPDGYSGRLPESGGNDHADPFNGTAGDRSGRDRDTGRCTCH